MRRSLSITLRRSPTHSPLVAVRWCGTKSSNQKNPVQGSPAGASADGAINGSGTSWLPSWGSGMPGGGGTRQWLVLGALFLVGGAILDLFSSRKEVIITKLLEYFVTTVQVRSHQEAFPMVVDFISSLPGAESSVRNFMVNGGPGITSSSSSCDVEDYRGGVTAASSSVPDSIALRPGLGTYMLKYKGTWMTVSRSVDTDRSKNVNLTNDLPQVVTLTLWTTDKSVAMSLLRDAYTQHNNKRGAETKVYIPDASGFGWQYLGSRLKRDPWTLFFPAPIQEGVSSEVATYLKSESAYRQLGVPWRRGYLFYGPPGTGKSSFISALAAEHDLPVYLLQNLGGSGGGGGESGELGSSGGGGVFGAGGALPRDDQLLSLLNSCARPSIVVLEDLDTTAAALSGGDGSGPSPRISGLLNALDGIASTDGRIIIATANRVELIPPALRRPGRIDREIHFDQMSEVERQRMKEWYSKKLGSTTGTVVDDEVVVNRTPAELQHKLLSETLYSSRNQ